VTAAAELGVSTGWLWREPIWFVLVPVLLALLGWAAWRRAGVPVSEPPRGERLPGSWRRRLRAVPAVLEGLALLLGVAALARPVQRLPAPPERLARDVVVCLDTSSSMAAEDLAPGRSRLAVARTMAAALVGARAGDRLGCVTFARYADLRCPPTLDHAALQQVLAGIEPVAADGPEDATGIGAAVAAAAEVLARSPSPGRVVVLLTDGEENVATSDRAGEIAPLHAAQLCATFGVRVHSVDVGRGQQLADGRYAPLDTAAVQQLAAGTGGRFFEAHDAAALLAVGREIDGLEAARFAEPRHVVREWFASLVAVAVGLLCGAHWLGRTWLRVVP
jgi:Ca-activated chloride channel family protein